MKKSELKQIIKEEIQKILNESGTYGKESRKYKISPSVIANSGGPSDKFKTPYLTIWLNGGSVVYVPIKQKPDEAKVQKFADTLANELENAIDKSLKVL